LIQLKGEDALKELFGLWNGKKEDKAEMFNDETGEDYEQCLVDYLTSIRHHLSPLDSERIVARFKTDPQF